MLQCIYLKKKCVQKALIYISLLDGESFSFSNNEIKMKLSIIKPLISIKDTVKALCSRDENLFTIKIAINFKMLITLSVKNYIQLSFFRCNKGEQIRVGSFSICIMVEPMLSWNLKVELVTVPSSMLQIVS